MVVFWAATAGMFANIFVNWLLIYGNWGMPKLGVAGAAWGTNTAIFVELVIVATMIFSPAVRSRFNTFAWRFDRIRTRELLRAGIPSGFQTAGDVFAWNIFFGGVLAAYGTAALAASIYAIQFMKLAFMPAFGLSVAVTALVARHLGEGRPDLSAARAHLGFKVAATYMLGCGVVFFFAGRSLIRMFSADAEVIRIGGVVLVFCALFQLFDALFIIYSGALRGVRDTFVPACVQITLCWLMVVGGGIAVAKYARGWGVGGPWAIGVVYVAILGTFLMLRFRAGRWQNPNATERGFEVVPVPDPV
jgi:MATE family multidrug resistance protein